MAFNFTCPYCLHKTLVSEEFSGRRGPCVNCGKDVVIPEPPGASRAGFSPAGLSADSQLIAIGPRRRWKWMIKLVLYLVIALPVLLGILWMVRPAVVQLRTQRDVSVCKQNLQRIAKALNAYAADYGTYPPPVTMSPASRPMHSWRVLILPYLGENARYAEYDLSKPWDAPENMPLRASCPSVFISPGSTQAVGETSYMLVTGPGTLFPAGRLYSPSKLPDGPSNILLVVETTHPNQAWTEPIDLDVSKLPAQIGALNGIGGNHPGGATVVFADNQAGWLPSNTTLQTILQLLTPEGYESTFGSAYQR